MFWEVLLIITNVLFIILGIYGIYMLIVTLPMFKEYQTPVGPDTPVRRFCILICARNEDTVIGNLIDSLSALDYPADSYSVFVVADNCTDNSAAIAREHGAIVMERFDEEKQTKGYAMNWFFDRFFEEYGGQYDSCLVIDADNVATSNYLRVMNQQRNLGKRVIVGYRKGKNPAASAISGCNSLFWLMQRRAHDHPRANLGLSLITTGGSGFAFDLSLIEDTGWNTHTIAEDIEFGLNTILRGEKIGYIKTAQNFDEQPSDWRTTYKQQLRWRIGMKQVFVDKTGKFFRQLVKGRIEALDPLMYCLGFLVMALAPIIWVLNLLSQVMISGNWLGLLITLLVSAVGGYLVLALFALYLVVAEKQVWHQRWKAVLSFPIFILLTSLIIYPAIFIRRPVWEKISHTDQAGIEDLA